MKTTPLYYYTSIRNSTRRAARVTGPLSFLKLALEDLGIPFLYSRRSMSIEAGQGASFHVRHFDVDYDLYYHNEITAPGQPRGLRAISMLPSPTYPKGQWLVSKHLAPVSQDEREIYALDEQSVDAYKLEAISLEMRVLSHEPLQNHPNIVNLVAFMWEKHLDEFGRRWPILVLQDADCGTLLDFSQLDTVPLDTSEIALSIANDIASGLVALHACGVVHGDLKFENILIFEQHDGSFCAKISDFGLCSVVIDLAEAEVTAVRLPALSRPWEAPEAYDDVLVEDLPLIDVYGFGLLLCRLMTSGLDIFEEFSKRDPISPGPSNDANMNVGKGGLVDQEEYDFDKIQKLKNEKHGMIDYAKRFLKLNSKAASAELETLFQVVECSLPQDPDSRRSINDIRNLLLGKEIDEDESTISLVPRLSPCGLPEEIYHWSHDLKLAVKDDIVNELITKSHRDTPDKAADALYWLSSWSLSGDLGTVSYENGLKWLMTAAEKGSAKARARIWNSYAALGTPFPHHRNGELEQWLVDAVLHDEFPGSRSLVELFPGQFPAALEGLRTIYCGYGQDCFGDQWRRECPLEPPERFMEIILHSGLDINHVHDSDGSGMTCNMTWLHYAASMGNLRLVQLLLQHGSDPNVLNGYAESPFFMACQAGHYDVACCLLPITELPTDSKFRSTTELHFLDRFEETVLEDIASKLLAKGVDIDSRNNIAQTPLNAILDRNAVNCMNAVLVLLRKGADPLVKDHTGIHPLSQAAVNLSKSQFTEVLRLVPPERRLEAQADVLWALMELSTFESLVRGGTGYCQKLRDILEMLAVDDSVCQQLETMTCHPLLTLACGSAPIEMVRILLDLRPKSEINTNLYRGSFKDWHTPLHAAVVENRLDVVRLLLDSGADPTLFSPAGWTPLFYAVIRSTEIVSVLLQHVFDTKPERSAIDFLDKRDRDGATAFAIAVVGQFFESADILASYGTNYLAFSIPYSTDSLCFMNILGWSCCMAPQVKYLFSKMDDHSAGFIVDNEGTTILHCVAGFPIDRTTEEEARQLLDMVLQRFSCPELVNSRDAYGMTPLHYAGRFGNVISVEKLCKTFGDLMDLEALNSDGLTALEEAEGRVFHDIQHLGRLAQKIYNIRTNQTVTMLRNMTENWKRSCI